MHDLQQVPEVFLHATCVHGVPGPLAGFSGAELRVRLADLHILYTFTS